MTLVIARRLNGKVSLAADSRLSFGNAGTFDQAIKIFKIPVKIKGPLKSFEDRDKWEFEYDYGMAITGSSTNAYTVKESLQAIIGSIQYMTNISDISIVGIGSFVHQRFKDISNALAPVLREGGLSEIIFAGWCIFEKRVRVLRFFAEVTTEKIEYRAQEILTNDGWFFAGSGRAVAEKIVANHADMTPLRVIKTVIENHLEPTVGGLLQVGGFPGQNFHITGVKEDLTDDNGVAKSFTHFVGFDLSQPNATRKHPLLYIPHGHIQVDAIWPLPPKH